MIIAATDLHGFADANVAHVPDPARLQPAPQLESFLAAVVLGTVLESYRLRNARKPSISGGATAGTGGGYVRLQLRRGGQLSAAGQRSCAAGCFRIRMSAPGRGSP